MNTDTDQTELLQQASAAYANIQDAARRTANMRRKPVLVQLGQDEVKTWVGHQAEDIAAGAAAIMNAVSGFGSDLPKDAQDIIEKMRDLEKRTKSVGDMFAKSVEVARLCDDAIADLTSVNPVIKEYATALKKDDFEKIDDALVSELKNAFAKINGKLVLAEGVLEEIEPDLDPTRIERILQSAGKGARPLQAVLAKYLDDIQSIMSKVDVPAPAPAPDDVVPAKETTPDNVAPINAPPQHPMAQMAPPDTDKIPVVMKRKLGRKLSAHECERISESYFKKLWAQGVDQSKLADIMFFSPSDANGMTIYDMLDYLNGRDVLFPMLKELQIRFPAPD